MPLNLRILHIGIQTTVSVSPVVVPESAATLQVRQGAKGAKGSRAWAAFYERPLGCWNDADYWTVTGRAREAVVARKQMFQELIDFTVLVAAQFDIFLEGQISRAARLFSGLKGRNRFKPDAVKLVTRLVCWHGRRNNTITGMSRNGTLVLRNPIASLYEPSKSPRIELDLNQFD